VIDEDRVYTTSMHNSHSICVCCVALIGIGASIWRRCPVCGVLRCHDDRDGWIKKLPNLIDIFETIPVSTRVS